MLQCDNPHRTARAGVRRQHLLDTARTLFVERGFHGTGMAQIAAASGIGVGQIYRDFASKEAIIAAIAEADVTAWLEEDVLAAAVAAGDADAIRAWIGRFGKADEPRCECRMMAEVLAESGRNPRIAEMYRAIDARVRARLSAALAALAPAGRDCALSLLVEFILAAGFGVTARRIVRPEIPAAALGRFVEAVLDREIDALAR